MKRSRRSQIDKLLRELRQRRQMLEGCIYQIGEISRELFDLASFDEGDLAGELDPLLCDVQEQVEIMHNELDGAPHDGEVLDNALAAYRKANPLKKAKKKASRRQVA